MKRYPKMLFLMSIMILYVIKLSCYIKEGFTKPFFRPISAFSHLQNPHICLLICCGFECAQALLFPDASGLVFQSLLEINEKSTLTLNPKNQRITDIQHSCNTQDDAFPKRF